jgi:3'-5' exonuclease
MKPTLYLDIETLPAPESFLDGVEIKAPATHKKPESIAAWIAENGDTYRDEQHRKTSFNGGWGSDMPNIMGH